MKQRMTTTALYNSQVTNYRLKSVDGSGYWWMAHSSHFPSPSMSFSSNEWKGIRAGRCKLRIKKKVSVTCTSHVRNKDKNCVCSCQLEKIESMMNANAYLRGCDDCYAHAGCYPVQMLLDIHTCGTAKSIISKYCTVCSPQMK